MEFTDFGWALSQLRAGEHVRRRGWNGKGMRLLLEWPRSSDRVPHITLQTVSGHLVPWTASQSDVLAEDWEIA